jgi:hypothetical protein
MQLRTTPAEREYKEKVNSKRKRKSKLRLATVPNTISYYSHKKHR